MRFAKANEKHECDKDIVSNFKQKIEDAISDIDNIDAPILAGTECLSADARDITAEDLIDCDNHVPSVS